MPAVFAGQTERSLAMRRHTYLMMTVLASLVLPLTVTGGGNQIAAAEDSSYKSETINMRSHYRIESNGAPFYIAFDKARTTYETSRFSYIFDEFSYETDDLDKGGIFVSDVSSVASSYKEEEHKTFSDIFRTTYNADPGAGEWDDYCKERLSFMFQTGTYYSLLFFKASETSQTEAIIRNNVDDYEQASLGSYADTKGMDGRYGFYFDGAKVTLSFLATFLFGYNCTLYYQDGVTVAKDESTITPTIETEDYDVKDGNPADIAAAPIYNSTLCYIPFTKKADPEDTVVEFNHIEINGERRDDVAFKQDGTSYFIATKLNDGDSVKLVTKKTVVHEDKNVVIHDLYDVSDQTEITFNKLGDASYGVGNIPNEVNNAFRFVLNTPKVDGSAWVGEKQTKFGIWSSNESLWSNFGYIIRFAQGVVSILSGEEEPLARGESASIVSRSALVIVIGLAKLSNEANHWYANRVYVDVNDVRVAQYDDVNRRTLGSVITGPYIGEAGGEVSFEDYRKDSLVSVSDSSNNAHVKASFPSYAIKGEKLNATFVLEEGYKFSSFSVNGSGVLDKLTYVDGVYSLEIEDVSSSIDITYTLLSDVHVTLGLEGDVINTVYDSFPFFGSRNVVKFGVKDGHIPSSVLVNDVECISSLKRAGKVYSLELVPLAEDTKIVVSATEKVYSVALAHEMDDGHASIKLSSSSVKAGGSVSFDVVLEEGYLLMDVSITGGAVLSSSNGTYYLDEVYGDVTISLKTKKKETAESVESASMMWIAYLLYGLAGASLLGFGIYALIAIRRKKAE